MNLVLEVILKHTEKGALAKGIGFDLFGELLHALAYADDLVCIASNPLHLQTLLNLAGDAATRLGLTFKPGKCASFDLNCTKDLITRKALPVNKQVLDTTFTIQGKAMPALKDGEHYRYLGVQTGARWCERALSSLIEDATGTLDRIRTSLLALWQKLDAIRPFVQPSSFN